MFSACRLSMHPRLHRSTGGFELTQEARKALGLTQPQLALASGVGVRFIVDLEAGKPTVRLEHVLRVLHSLGLTLAICDLPDVHRVQGSGA